MKKIVLAALIALCGVSFGFGLNNQCIAECMQKGKKEAICIIECKTSTPAATTTEEARGEEIQITEQVVDVVDRTEALIEEPTK